MNSCCFLAHLSIVGEGVEAAVSGIKGGTMIEVAARSCQGFDADCKYVSANAVDSFLHRLTAHFDTIGRPPRTTAVRSIAMDFNI